MGKIEKKLAWGEEIKSCLGQLLDFRLNVQGKGQVG